MLYKRMSWRVMKKKIKIFIGILLFGLSFPGYADEPDFSVAGFLPVEGCGREVFSMNPAWRFYRGALAGAEVPSYDDSSWRVVSLPHGIEYLPVEASGCVNYQGEVWYRKHFVPEKTLRGRKLFLHFEAIMGKSRIYMNGKLLTEHFGGYLPVSVDVTDELKWDEENVVAVWADNSNDPTYAPGKPQDMLDYAYFGGIYRDCWLIAHSKVYITDPNYERETAGGGLFVATSEVSDTSADILLRLHLRNDGGRDFTGRVVYSLEDRDGRCVASAQQRVSLPHEKAASRDSRLRVVAPQLWSPLSPYLYDLYVRVYDNHGNVIDGYRRRVGIRSIEFRGKDGFFLNGKPYGKPLIGVNRHQDFALVGNAVPNSIHWRDAKKLKALGIEVIRNAHCPQDPAFMDACDELGLFVIVNTPGWQFWSDDPLFGRRVCDDIRNMVRRDRNHPCVWLWEPVLNETWYPEDFAAQARDIVREEYPYPSCYSGCDMQARGAEFFSVQFTHPLPIEKRDSAVTYFTREWGDHVDSWNSHNSPSRAARNWGERPMLIQAEHYASPRYECVCYDALFRQSPHHVGGCLWHAFDHQRGYHPDPFYGGLMDAFRQPKYAYYMFMAQRPVRGVAGSVGTGPMVYIAHAMTPFSDRDVTVYSNCDEVRLTFTAGGASRTYRRDSLRGGMPSPIIVFPEAYDFTTDKDLTRAEHGEDVWLLAEGLIDGEVVARHKIFPARRPEQIRLRVDDEGVGLQADGSDFVTVIAEVTDRNGNVKRLNNHSIRFHVEGEGRILGDADIQANPAPVRWGSAPVLIQSTTVPGKIRITASALLEGSQMPVSGELELTTKKAMYPLLFDVSEAARISRESSFGDSTGKETETPSDMKLELERLRMELNALRLKEVGRQQTDFGEKAASERL